MASAYIEKRKQQEICLRCKQKAPIGQAVCFDCTDKMTAAKRAALAQGLCIHCWHEPVVAGRQHCMGCKAQDRFIRARRRAIRKQQGLCVKCGKAPQWHGHTTCAYCYGKHYEVS